MKIATASTLLVLVMTIPGNSAFFNRITSLFGGNNETETSGGGFLSTVFSAFPEIETENLGCAAQSLSDANDCNLAPFSGTFVCREFASFLGFKSMRTVCAPNIVEGVTLGAPGDTCGCCDGECPVECPCKCGDPGNEDGKVYVRPVIIGQRYGRDLCVTDGTSKHLTAWGGRVQCVPEDECPSDTSSPTSAPTF